MVLYFIIFMLVLGTIFEFVLHRREIRFLKQKLGNADEALRLDTDLIRDLLKDQAQLYNQCLASQRVADAGDKQVIMYHERNMELVAANEHLRVTVVNLEASVEALSAELDDYMLQHAKRVLGATIVAQTTHHDGERFTSLPLDEV